MGLLKLRIKLFEDEIRRNGLAGFGAIFWFVIRKCFYPTRIWYSPRSIQIEPTTSCNLMCKMCDRTVSGRPDMNMSFVDFKKIVDQFPRLSQITLQGVGEPLMAPDFFLMVRYVKKRNINVRFFTNGVFLNHFAVEIIENNIDMVLVSLDAASRDTFRAVRGKDLFLKVLSGIEALVSAKKEGGGISPGIAVNTVVLKDNYQELTDIVELIYDMGVGEWRVGFPMFWGGKEDLRQSLSLTAQEFKSMKEKIGVAQARAIQLGINVIPKDSNTWTWIRTKCDVPWTGCYVTVEGFATPCCVIADPAVINFGNLLETPFSVIRNNTLFRTFRREMRSGIPRACIGCKYDPNAAILSW